MRTVPGGMQRERSRQCLSFTVLNMFENLITEIVKDKALELQKHRVLKEDRLVKIERAKPCGSQGTGSVH